ncbi:MAG: hypothetical protein ACE366_27020 [Bradymonadia bacterium]
MMRSLYRALCCATAMLALTACRGDSGPDDYASQEIIPDAFLPIDASIVEGEERLNMGLFYEGPAMDQAVIDGTNNFFYVYESTFSLVPEARDRVEGSASDRLNHGGGPWWGGGIHWENAPRDITRYTNLHISLKSNFASYAGLRMAMQDTAGGRALVTFSDYGFAADGEWHSMVIPLQDFADAGVDLTTVEIAIAFDGDAGERGESVLVDGLFLSAPSASDAN